MSSSLLVFLVLLLGYTFADVVVQDQAVTFQRQDNGRFWPMPDNFNPGILMVHGRHCYDIMVETANKGGKMTKMHREHCQALLKQIVHLFDTNPSYHVNPWICEGLTGQKWQGKQGMVENMRNMLLGWGFDYNYKDPEKSSAKGQNLLAPDNGIHYGIDYKDQETPAKVQNLLAPDNGINYGIDYRDPEKKAPAKLQNLLAPDNGIHYGIDYKDQNTPVKAQNLLAPDNGISYGIDYKDPEKKAPAKLQNLLAPDNGIHYGIDYKDQEAPAKVQNLLAPDNGIHYGIDYKDQNTPIKAQNLLAPDNGIHYGIDYKDAEQKAPAKGQNLLAPDNGIHYGIDYKDQEAPAKVQNLLAPDNGIHYGIDYKDQEAPAKVQNLLAPDNGISYGIDYKNPDDPPKKHTPTLHDVISPKNSMKQQENLFSRSWSGFNRYISAGTTVKNQKQDETFVKLMADNFGDLLMTNWMNPESITPSERQYLAQWESESAVAMGAVGLYCHVQGNMQAIRDMATAKI